MEGMTKKKNLISSVNCFNLLRGIMALWIVIGHCSMEYEREILPLLLIHKFNLVWVGVFFFLSGWGLELSVDVKEDYLKGFLCKKCTGILRMTVSMYLFQIISFATLKVGGEYDWDVVFFLQDYVRSTNWYMWELLFFYLVFYFSHKYIKSNHIQLLCISCIALGIVLLLPYTNIGSAYYFSSLGFPAGIFLYRYRDTFEKWFTKRPIQIFICLCLVSAVCLLSLLLPQKNSISALV